MQTEKKFENGWADRPEVRRWIRFALYSICLLLLLLEFFIHRHTEVWLEKLPAFYSLYGFAALIVAVSLAKILRRMVGREEDYYKDDD